MCLDSPKPEIPGCHLKNSTRLSLTGRPVQEYVYSYRCLECWALTGVMDLMKYRITPERTITASSLLSDSSFKCPDPENRYIVNNLLFLQTKILERENL